MTTQQIVSWIIGALGVLAGGAAWLRAPSQNRRDEAHGTDLIVDAAVDLSQEQRTTITDLRRRLEKAERRADAAERRAIAAERRAEQLSSRLEQLEEQVTDLLARRPR